MKKKPKKKGEITLVCDQCRRPNIANSSYSVSIAKYGDLICDQCANKKKPTCLCGHKLSPEEIKKRDDLWEKRGQQKDWSEIVCDDPMLGESALMICACKNKCNPAYFTLKDLEGLNIVLYHVNEENNELGLKDDIVRTPIKALLSSEYQRGRDDACKEFVVIVEKMLVDDGGYEDSMVNIWNHPLKKAIKKIKSLSKYKNL
jgi:hypothetical protein